MELGHFREYFHFPYLFCVFFLIFPFFFFFWFYGKDLWRIEKFEILNWNLFAVKLQKFNQNLLSWIIWRVIFLPFDFELYRPCVSVSFPFIRFIFAGFNSTILRLLKRKILKNLGKFKNFFQINLHKKFYSPWFRPLLVHCPWYCRKLNNNIN